jgi:FkbM family methyltransferase
MSAGSRLDAFLDEWQRSAVLRSRLPYFLNRILGKKGVVTFADGSELSVNRQTSATMRKLVYFAYLGAPLAFGDHQGSLQWHVDFDSGEIRSPDGLRFHLDSFDPFIFAETFLANIHDEQADMRGKTVVDVGAYVGDTSIYFASQGAQVLAYEPDERNFSNLLLNLDLNPSMRDRVRPFQLAVGEAGEVQFTSGRGSSSRVVATTSETTRVQSTSLTKILGDNNLQNPFLLKADCKGCEFKLVAEDVISRFDRLAIEYAATGKNTPERLLNRLREVGFGSLQISKHSWDHQSIETTGLVRARRTPGPTT